MSRRPITLSLAALGSTALVASVPAVSGAREAPAARTAAAGAKVQVRHTGLGALLVNGHGFTLYAFSRDKGGRDQCVRISGCRSVWLPDITHGRPVAGPGVRRSSLGRTRIGNATEVTYAGHPLYTYVGDAGPGQTSYVGVSQFGGRWSGMMPSGRLVR